MSLVQVDSGPSEEIKHVNRLHISSLLSRFKSALSLQQTPERVSAHLSPGLKPPAEEEDPNNKTRRNVFRVPSQKREV